MTTRAMAVACAQWFVPTACFGWKTINQPSRIWMAAWSAAPVPRIVKPALLWFPPVWDALLILFKHGSKAQSLDHVQAAAAVNFLQTFFKPRHRLLNCLTPLNPPPETASLLGETIPGGFCSGFSAILSGLSPVSGRWSASKPGNTFLQGWVG